MKDKKDLLNKWSSILGSVGLTGSQLDNLSELAENQSNQILNQNTEVSEFPTILPMAMKVAAQTIGQNLVTVKPMPHPGISQEEIDRINSEIKKENRDGKIDAIVEGKDYKELKPEEHPDWNPGPVGSLFYLDYKYSHKKTRRAGKKHKKKSNG